MNQRIFEILQDSGVGAVNFFGHGNIDWHQWRFPYWRTIQAYQLSNAPWFPIVYSFACANGFIRSSVGSTEGLAEAWTESPRGGAVGVAAVSGFGIAGPTGGARRVPEFAAVLGVGEPPPVP